jgi:hypothetical protein
MQPAIHDPKPKPNVIHLNTCNGAVPLARPSYLQLIAITAVAAFIVWFLLFTELAFDERSNELDHQLSALTHGAIRGIRRHMQEDNFPPLLRLPEMCQTREIDKVAEVAPRIVRDPQINIILPKFGSVSPTAQQRR